MGDMNKYLPFALLVGAAYLMRSQSSLMRALSLGALAAASAVYMETGTENFAQNLSSGPAVKLGAISGVAALASSYVTPNALAQGLASAGGLYVGLTMGSKTVDGPKDSEKK